MSLHLPCEMRRTCLTDGGQVSRMFVPHLYQNYAVCVLYADARCRSWTTPLKGGSAVYSYFGYRTFPRYVKLDILSVPWALELHQRLVTVFVICHNYTFGSMKVIECSVMICRFDDFSFTRFEDAKFGELSYRDFKLGT